MRKNCAINNCRRCSSSFTSSSATAAAQSRTGDANWAEIFHFFDCWYRNGTRRVRYVRFPPPVRRRRCDRRRSRDGARTPRCQSERPSLERQMPPNVPSPHPQCMPFFLFFSRYFLCFDCWFYSVVHFCIIRTVIINISKKFLAVHIRLHELFVLWKVGVCFMHNNLSELVFIYVIPNIL